MKVLVIEPHKPPYPLEIDGTLVEMKKLLAEQFKLCTHSATPLPLSAMTKANCLVCH